ncbi:MAG: hypothetical protein ACRDRJ_52350, partial [Streptosporangiaceae bacterium]
MTAPGAAPTLGGVGNVDEAAAWRGLEAAVDEALWRYAEAVTGVARDRTGQIVEGPSFAAGRLVHLARLSAIRRVRQALGASERCSPTLPGCPGRSHGSATGPAEPSQPWVKPVDGPGGRPVSVGMASRPDRPQSHPG